MNCTVFTGPDPCSNLQELLRRTPLGSGYIYAAVPDVHSVFMFEREILACRGEASLGHRIVTIEGLCRDILSPSGRVPGIISGYAKRALLAEIVRSRIKDNSRYYTVSRFPGFISLLVMFLEYSRGNPERVRAKDPEIVSIAGAYESHLIRMGLTDHEGIVTKALDSGLVERFVSRCDGPFIIEGFYDLTDKQLELFTLIARLSNRSAATCMYDASRQHLFSLPERLLKAFESIGAKVVTVPFEPSSAPGRVCAGFGGGIYGTPGDSGSVEVHMFMSGSSEADWVCGTIRSMILKGDCKPEDVMIVSRFRHDFWSPMAAALKKHGIPVEDGIARTLVSHPLVRVILDALDASIAPREEDILKVQTSVYTGSADSHVRPPLETADDRAWTCIVAENDSPEGFVQSLKKMIEWLTIKENLTGGGFKKKAVYEAGVFEKFLGLLDEFAEFYYGFIPMMKAKDFNRLLKRFINDAVLPDMVAPGRGILALDAVKARHVRRKIVFLTGLDNTSFPAAGDSYSLFDPETASAVRLHREREEALLFLMSITGAEMLFLTFPGIDDEGKDSSMSPYLRDIIEGFGCGIVPQFHPGVPGDSWMGGYVSERGRRETIIRTLRDSGKTGGELMLYLHENNPPLCREITSAVRAHVHFSESFDMNLTGDTSRRALGLMLGIHSIFHVTELELYCMCPVKFFLTCILDLEIDEVSPDALDPAERGSIVHIILAHLYSALIQECGSVRNALRKPETWKPLLKSILEKAFSSRTDIIRRLHPYSLNSEKKHILRWMETLMGIEADYLDDSHYEPFLFEVSFGKDTDSTLDISHGGNTVAVCGRIDRIDKLKTGDMVSAQVVDYKTGVNKNNVNIQVPLYMKAVRDVILPETSFVSGLYYYLIDARYDTVKRKLSGCKLFNEHDNETIEDAVRRAVQAGCSILEGRFPAPERCSRRCEWRPVCRGDRTAVTEDDDAIE